jgi:ribosomal protein S27AE
MEKKLLEELRCLLESLGCAFCLPTAKHLEALRLLLSFIDIKLGENKISKKQNWLCPGCGDGYTTSTHITSYLCDCGQMC